MNTNSDLENKNENTQPTKPANKAQLIALLFAIDIVVVIGTLILQEATKDVGKIFAWPAILLHISIGIWIGVILHKTYPKRWVVIAYWIAVLIPPSSFVAPFLLLPLHFLFIFGPLPTSIFIQWAILITILSDRFTKGRWPLFAGILFVLCAIALIAMNMSFRTDEFGPLGMLFGNFLAAPFFFLLPALIRISANETIKPYVVRLQYTTYGLAVFAWIIFFIRGFLMH